MTVLKGTELLADDILRLSFFPVGTIMMYDGTGWKDNDTLKGWYMCDGNNGTPDLRDRFLYYDTGTIQGSYSSTRNNVETLSQSTTTNHSHTRNLTVASSSNDAHTHSISLSGADDRNFSYVSGQMGIMDTDTGGATTHAIRPESSGSHDHAVQALAMANAGSGEKFSLLPLCYKLIFIKKIE